MPLLAIFFVLLAVKIVGLYPLSWLIVFLPLIAIGLYVLFTFVILLIGSLVMAYKSRK